MFNEISVRIDSLKDFWSNRRDMGEIEVWGATVYLFEALKQFNLDEHGENHATFEDVASDTTYSGFSLYIQGTGYELRDSEGDLVYLDSVFMIEGNIECLYGKAIKIDAYEKDNYEDSYFLVEL